MTEGGQRVQKTGMEGGAASAEKQGGKAGSECREVRREGGSECIKREREWGQ